MLGCLTMRLITKYKSMLLIYGYPILARLHLGSDWDFNFDSSRGFDLFLKSLKSVFYQSDFKFSKVLKTFLKYLKAKITNFSDLFFSKSQI